MCVCIVVVLYIWVASEVGFMTVFLVLQMKCCSSTACWSQRWMCSESSMVKWKVNIKY